MSGHKINCLSNVEIFVFVFIFVFVSISKFVFMSISKFVFMSISKFVFPYKIFKITIFHCSKFIKLVVLEFESGHKINLWSSNVTIFVLFLY